MTTSFRQVILNRSQPLIPVPTKAKPKYQRLQGIRAVLFDIYGTLLISGSGDIGCDPTTESSDRGDAFVQALSENGLALTENGLITEANGNEGVQLFIDEIDAAHRQAKQVGVEFPEVDIVDIWRRTISRLTERGLVNPSSEPSLLILQRIALAYELQTNPVWPMPCAQSCLAKLHRMEIPLGFVSNAQFLTIELWKTLLQQDSDTFAIDEELQIYSYQHGHAKPGIKLYEQAVAELGRRAVSPAEVLYIGNDMLNDMMPAQKIGFRTALFAGDARSLRLREDDPRVVGVRPDLVLTSFVDLPDCIG